MNKQYLPIYKRVNNIHKSNRTYLRLSKNPRYDQIKTLLF